MSFLREIIETEILFEIFYFPYNDFDMHWHWMTIVKFRREIKRQVDFKMQNHVNVVPLKLNGFSV